jgi:hypothetical protein
MYIVLLIILILLLLGALPPIGLHDYGWGPSGIVVVLLIVVLVLMLRGRA